MWSCCGAWNILNYLTLCLSRVLNLQVVWRNAEALQIVLVLEASAWSTKLSVCAWSNKLRARTGTYIHALLWNRTKKTSNTHIITFIPVSCWNICNSIPMMILTESKGYSNVCRETQACVMRLKPVPWGSTPCHVPLHYPPCKQLLKDLHSGNVCSRLNSLLDVG